MTNTGAGSVTGWISALNDKDSVAQGKIWERFASRLYDVANKKLGYYSRRVADAEDVVVMAFENFFRKTPDQYKRLVDRNDLWTILTVIAVRRAIDIIRKRPPYDLRVYGETELISGDGSQAFRFDDVVDEKLSTEFGVILADELNAFLESLDDDTWRAVALGKMQGLANKEIAAKIKMSHRSVERKVKYIRDAFKAVQDSYLSS